MLPVKCNLPGALHAARVFLTTKCRMLSEWEEIKIFMYAKIWTQRFMPRPIFMGREYPKSKSVPTHTSCQVACRTLHFADEGGITIAQKWTALPFNLCKHHCTWQKWHSLVRQESPNVDPLVWAWSVFLLTSLPLDVKRVSIAANIFQTRREEHTGFVIEVIIWGKECRMPSRCCWFSFPKP